MIKGNEAKIIINDVELSEDLSGIIRLAVLNFEKEMSQEGVLGYDRIGMTIAGRYSSGASEILKLIFKNTKQDL